MISLFQAIARRRAVLSLSKGRSVILPLVLIVAALLFLNWGLHRVLNPPEPFGPYALPYSQDFEDVYITRWFTGEGDWAVRDGALRQGQEKVGAAHIFIPYWLIEGQPYRYSAQLLLSDSARAAGLDFNAQYPDIYATHQRVAVVRRDDADADIRELELIAGYVNEIDGFQVQASVPISRMLLAAGSRMRLEVVVYEDTYDVRLNGQTLLEDRALVYHDGLVGMYAAGGPVSFDNVILTTADDDAYQVELVDVEDGLSAADHYEIGDLVYTSDFVGDSGGAGWTPFSGSWQVEDGLLVQSDTAGYDRGIGYEGSEFQTYALQVTLSHIEGSGAGVLFNMPTPYQTAGAHMVRYSDSGNGVFWGYYDEAAGAPETRKFVGQGSAAVGSPGDAAHTFKIISGAETYSVYLDSQIIARDVPLLQNRGYIGLVTSRSAAAYHLVEIFDLLTDVSAPRDPRAGTGDVTPTAVVVAEEARGGGRIVAGDLVHVAEDALLTGDPGDGGWIPISGDWQIADGLLIQVDSAKFDAAIGYEGNTFQRYVLEVSLAHREGVGGGVLFNMPQPYQLDGAHMVRYSDNADAIFWGYYDDTGAFVGQGYAHLDAPGTARHTFRITCGETSYDIDVDGQPMARDIPLARNSGHIGLITTRSAAAFGPIEISALGGAPQTPRPDTGTGDLLAGMRAVSGDWTVEGSTIRQESQETGDFVMSTGVLAVVYSFEATITLPDDPELNDAGGGIIFHMPEPDSKKNAHMVRLTAGGGAFWGYFDQSEVFIGQGWAAPPDDGSTTYNLKINVQQNTYELLINGDSVAQNVQLMSSEGWIGLLSYRGPIVFNDIRLTIGGGE